MLPTMIKNIRNFRQDERGAVAIMFVVFANMFFGMMSLAIDLGIGYMGVSRALNASTAAAINAAIMKDPAAAKKYFGANLPSGQFGLKYDYDKDVDVEMADGVVSVIPRDFDSPTFFPLGKGQTAGNSGLLQLSTISSVGMPGSDVVPADYIFIVDVSGSMGAVDSYSPTVAGKVSRMDAVKHATILAVDSIFTNAEAEKHYTVSIVTYDGRTKARMYPSNDKEVIKGWINSYFRPDGGTCGSCGIQTADEIEDQTAQDVKRQKIYLFMTDGVSYLDPYSWWNGVTMPDYSGVPLRMRDMPADFVKEAGVDYITTVVNGKTFKYSFTTMAWLCNEGMKFEAGDSASVWAIRFGNDVGDVAGKDAIHTMNYCASNPDQSVWAEDGIALNKLYQQIIRKVGSLRVLK